jgi:hypothetical protein
MLPRKQKKNWNTAAIPAESSNIVTKGLLRCDCCFENRKVLKKE